MPFGAWVLLVVSGFEFVAMVDATIVTTLPLVRHAIIARIRSSAIAPFLTQSLTDVALAPTTRAAAVMLAPSMRI